jgi:hypothetical protein
MVFVLAGIQAVRVIGLAHRRQRRCPSHVCRAERRHDAPAPVIVALHIQ